MAIISMKQLLEAGVHFGHQTRRWNPKMAPYIFTERNGIYIIDLQKTVKKVDEAYNFIREVAAAGENILFVGTKKQAQEAMKEEATRCNMFFVNERWLGGMLTNFKTIRTRIEKLENIEKMEELQAQKYAPALAEIERFTAWCNADETKKSFLQGLGMLSTIEQKLAYINQLKSMGYYK